MLGCVQVQALSDELESSQDAAQGREDQLQAELAESQRQVHCLLAPLTLPKELPKELPHKVHIIPLLAWTNSSRRSPNLFVCVACRLMFVVPAAAVTTEHGDRADLRKDLRKWNLSF